MPRKRAPITPAIQSAIASGEFIPLPQFLQERGWSRTTFYRHPEIPQIKVRGRRFVARVALGGGA